MITTVDFFILSVWLIEALTQNLSIIAEEVGGSFKYSEYLFV